MAQIVTFLTVSLALAAVTFADSPSYDGKPLDYWIGQLKSEDGSRLEKAVEAFSEMGKTSPKARRAMLEGVVAKGYLQPMVRVSGVLSERYGMFGEAGVPELIDALSHENEVIRRGAAYAIGSMGSDGAAAVPALVKRLEQGDDAIAKIAISSLRFVGPSAAKAMPFLMRRLDSEDADKRKQTIALLTALGPAASQSKDKLLRELTNGEAGYRVVVVKALAAVVPRGGSDVVASLTMALDDEEVRVVELAMQALGRIGPAAKPATEKIRKIMDSDSSFDVVPTAALAFWRITGKVDRPLEKLIQLLDDEYRFYSATEALGEMGAVAESAVPQLVKQFKNKDLFGLDRWIAAEALGKMGPAAKVATPALLVAAKTEKDYAAAYIATALWRIEKQADQVMPLVLETLDLNSGARLMIIRLIVEIGPAADAAKPKLEGLLEHNDKEVRRAAERALAGLARTKSR